MELVALFLFAVVLAVVFMGFDIKHRGRFTDKDKDGEPDEPDGPASGL